MPEFLDCTVDKFIFRVALDRDYTPEGVWAKFEMGNVRVGLSDFTQQRSGDVAFAQIMPVGTELKTGDEIGTIETIKVNISIESPLAGKIVAVNPAMESAPETINQDPYGEGWLVLIEPYVWETDRTCLMDAHAYFEYMKRLAEDEARKQ
jgi:glycine cleavage system H protein